VNLFPARVLKRVEGSVVEPLLMGLNRQFERSRGGVLEDAEFDVCIFSAALSMTLTAKINARHFIYRHNDLLAEFPTVPRSLLEFEDGVLHSRRLTAVCPVNSQLAESIRARNARLPLKVVPNGIDRDLFEAAEPDPELMPTRERNVAYVGAFNAWVDVELLLATAALLPDHRFHLYGSWAVPRPQRTPANVCVHAPIAHADAASKMKACAVGLIPYGVANARRMVEKPLKYYEYLASGMGVAATSYAGRDLEPYAAIGDSPDALADAIHRAKGIPAQYGDAIREELRRLDWRDLVREIIECCES